MTVQSEVSGPSTTVDFSLAQRYRAGAGPVLLTGVQAIGRLLVEQHARLALELAQDAIVLDRGAVVFAGPSRDLLAAPERLDALIGVAGSGAPAQRRPAP